MSGALYLLDTNIVSQMMRDAAGQAMQRVRALLQSEADSRLCTSVIVECELQFGIRRTSNPRWKARFAEAMALLDVMPLDETVCEPYARLRTELEQAGTPIGANDCLIAAHALALGATLVTNDAEFARVPGLSVENWLQA